MKEDKPLEPYEIAHLEDLKKQKDSLEFRLKRVEDMIKKAETHGEPDVNPGIK